MKLSKYVHAQQELRPKRNPTLMQNEQIYFTPKPSSTIESFICSDKEDFKIISIIFCGLFKEAFGS
jgi:hypothetical protein